MNCFRKNNQTTVCPKYLRCSHQCNDHPWLKLTIHEYGLEERFVWFRLKGTKQCMYFLILRGHSQTMWTGLGERGFQKSTLLYKPYGVKRSTWFVNGP